MKMAVNLTSNSRFSKEQTSSVPEELYPRDGFIKVDGKIVPVFLGHPKAACEICEFPFSNERKHPRDPERPDLSIICGGHRMRVVDKRGY